MTMLGRGKRDAADKARKAEKARQKADEAARKAAEAAEEAEQAAREAEVEAAEAAEAENGPEGDAEATVGAKGAGKSEMDVKAATRPTKAPESASRPASKTASKAAPKAAPKADPDPAPEEPAAKAAALETEVDPDAGSVDAKTAEVATPASDEAEDKTEDADGPAEADPAGGEPKVALAKKPARKTAGAEGDGDENTAENAADADESDADESDAAEDVTRPAVRKAGPSGRGSRTVGGLRPAAWVLVVVNVVLVAALVWLGMALQGVRGENKQAMDKVAFAASRAAEDLSSYDYRTIDADLKRATGHTTGKFRGEFDKLSATVKPSAVEGKTVVEGTAVKTAVESIEGDKAIALVYLNQQTAKGSSGERTPNQYSVRLVMKKVGDRWMVSELQMV